MICCTDYLVINDTSAELALLHRFVGASTPPENTIWEHDWDRNRSDVRDPTGLLRTHSGRPPLPAGDFG